MCCFLLVTFLFQKKSNLTDSLSLFGKLGRRHARLRLKGFIKSGIIRKSTVNINVHGTFSGTLKDGVGVTAQLLAENGIAVEVKD